MEATKLPIQHLFRNLTGEHFRDRQKGQVLLFIKNEKNSALNHECLLCNQMYEIQIIKIQPNLEQWWCFAKKKKIVIQGFAFNYPVF